MKNTGNYLIFAFSLILVFAINETFAQSKITGKVVYYNAEETPLEGVVVYLNDLDDVPLQTTLSNDIGYFEFQDVVSGTYKITATSDQLPPDVVNLLDISLLIDYLNGQASLDPLSEEAANVNGNSEIDIEDLNFIMENWYLYGEEFPIGDWVFEVKTVQAGEKDGEVVVNGACAADVSEDYDPDKNSGVQISNLNAVDVCEFSTMELPVKTDFNGSIKNFFIEIAYDQNSVSNIVIQPHLAGIKYSIENNLVKIIWADVSGKGISLNKYEKLFSIIINSNNNTTIDRDDLWLTKNCSFVTTENKFTTDLTLYIPQANNITQHNPQLINYPNPVSSSTTFQYYLSKKGDVRIELINSYGSVVENIFSGAQDEGINQFTINDIHHTSGLYITRLYLNNKFIANRTIIIQ